MENFKWEKSNEIGLPKNTSESARLSASEIAARHSSEDSLRRKLGYNPLDMPEKEKISWEESNKVKLPKHSSEAPRLSESDFSIRRSSDDSLRRKLGYNPLDLNEKVNIKDEVIVKGAEQNTQESERPPVDIDNEKVNIKDEIITEVKGAEQNTQEEEKSHIDDKQYKVVGKGVSNQINPRLINVSMRSFEGGLASENKLTEEATRIEEEIEAMPEEEKKKIEVGLSNLGFYATKLKSDAMAWICDKAVVGSEKPIQEQGAFKRFFSSLAETYKKDSEKAQKQIDSPSSLLSLKSASSVGQITGGILKWGRTVSDVVGWTAGSPLRYVMAGAQLFSRGAEAVKEARLINEEVIEKTRIKNIDEAAEQAWKIYEQAKIESEKSGQKEISKESLEAVYVKNLPQDLLERLKKTGPGTATGILQWILKKDLEIAINHGQIKIGEDGRIEKFFEDSFNKRLKEYDRMVSQYGEVDALALGAKYAETTGKAVIAGVQIETAALLIQRLPEMMSKLSHISIFENTPIEHPTPSVEHLIAETVPVNIKPIELSIGTRGPEGAIIDEFRNNLDLAKKFGWPGGSKEEFSKWAGSKAHILWGENAKQALLDPSVKQQLEELGYPETVEGYEEAMTRIGKGIVSLDIEKGSIKLDAEYLKNIISSPSHDTNILPENMPEEVTQPSLETTTHLVAEDFAKIQKQMDLPAGKLRGLFVTSGVSEKGLEDFIKREGGVEKLLKMPVRELHGLEQGYPRPVQLDRLYEGLGKITGEARLDSNDSLEDVLKSIDSKSIFHGTAEEILKGEIPPHLGINTSPHLGITHVAETPAPTSSDIPHEELTKSPEVKAPNIAKEIGQVSSNEVVTGTGVKGVFSYDSSGKITGIKPEGLMSPLQGKALLKDNYEELMKNKGAKLFDIQSVKTSALGLSQREQILKTLEESGQGKSDKAEFLRKVIKQTTDQIESKYGKIFKK